MSCTKKRCLCRLLCFILVLALPFNLLAYAEDEPEVYDIESEPCLFGAEPEPEPQQVSAPEPEPTLEPSPEEPQPSEEPQETPEPTETPELTETFDESITATFDYMIPTAFGADRAIKYALYETVTVKNGDTVVAPQPPAFEGWTFAAWKGYDGFGAPLQVAVPATFAVYAEYTPVAVSAQPTEANRNSQSWYDSLTPEQIKAIHYDNSAYLQTIIDGNSELALEIQYIEKVVLPDYVKRNFGIEFGSETVITDELASSAAAAYAILTEQTGNYPYGVFINSQSDRKLLQDLYLDMITVSSAGTSECSITTVNADVERIKSRVADSLDVFGMLTAGSNADNLVAAVRQSIFAINSGSELEKIINTIPDFGTVTHGRRTFVACALALTGKIQYFWGGKSASYGCDPRWTETRVMQDETSSQFGKLLSYGLDCSGYTAWCAVNAYNANIIGHGTASQWPYTVGIDWEDAKPGDLVFAHSAFTDSANHVGIVVEADGRGPTLIAHCTDGKGTILTSPDGIFNHARRMVEDGEDARLLALSDEELAEDRAVVVSNGDLNEDGNMYAIEALVNSESTVIANEEETEQRIRIDGVEDVGFDISNAVSVPEPLPENTSVLTGITIESKPIVIELEQLITDDEDDVISHSLASLAGTVLRNQTESVIDTNHAAAQDFANSLGESAAVLVGTVNALAVLLSQTH